MPVMTFAETRQALADAVNAHCPGLTVLARPDEREPAPDTGYVLARDVRPASFRQCLAVYVLVVGLGADRWAAEARYEELAVPLVDAVTLADGLLTTEVSVTPDVVNAGVNNAPFYVAALQVSAQVKG